MVEKMFAFCATAAPWTAAILCVVSAISAERAFTFDRKSQTPEPERDVIALDRGASQTIAEGDRRANAILASGWQRIATVLAAAGALSAAGASQQGPACLVLVTGSILFGIALALRQFFAMRGQQKYARDWALRLKFSLEHPYYDGNWKAQDADFAKAYPEKAYVNKGRR